MVSTLLGLNLYTYKKYKKTNEALSKTQGSEVNNKEDNKELEEIKLRLKAKEEELIEKEQILLSRDKLLNEKLEKILKTEKEKDEIQTELKSKEKLIQDKLESVAGMTMDEARKMLEEKVKDEMKSWISRKIKESEELIRMEAEERARQILIECMLDASTDYVAETTTTVITIEDENLKGKLIGKEGRNIRTFERLTGVDLIIDEIPNQVTISCFDPIRREVAALAIKKLLSDGRVHPGSIEETVEKVKKDILKEIKKTGEEILYEVGIDGLPGGIVMLLGRFKYRFSYGQNLVKHTLETVKIGERLATELKANTKVVKLACLLHDIGKVVPEEGKQHHHISAEIARKYFPNNELLANAIEAHHFDIEAKSIEAEIVRISDAISGARPGARRDNYEDYIKRIRALEDISNKQKGVKESFAIYAGREIRVIVKPEETTDEDLEIIAYNIAKEIEETQNYPGVIKVSVIREVRVTAEAK
ncbi:ribonuclease Y [Candidatus Dojkabacteria bacterium]|uniref:Ribonuclease Y n=1 Tax=Candidatus Dojkabacteria bacterium TaxID=2099670 RepID=A0A3M0Z0I3_9BACT|nr:MAG: ribonuclease Y [Candidatus Dojkabacteria bacterium]